MVVAVGQLLLAQQVVVPLGAPRILQDPAGLTTQVQVAQVVRARMVVREARAAHPMVLVVPARPLVVVVVVVLAEAGNMWGELALLVE